MSERQYWVGFNHVPGVGPVRVRRLLERFGSLEAAWHADLDSLAGVGLDRRTLGNMRKFRATNDPGTLLARMDRLGIAVLTWDDDVYPAVLRQLREIDQAPPVLYMRGTLTEADAWGLTIVGTRNASTYGRQVAYQIASDLARQRCDDY